MKTKTIFQRYFFWMIFAVAMAACSPSTPNIQPTQDSGSKALSTQIASTVIAQITQTFSPSQTPHSTQTLTAMLTKTRPATYTPAPPFVINGLHAIYSIKGNLYSQESGKKPIQLTNDAGGTRAFLSSDVQKVIFSRSSAYESRYEYEWFSINSDGSNEKLLINRAILITLNLGYNKATNISDMAFAFGSHQIVFTTMQKLDLHNISDPGQPNNDLLVVDIDTAKITQLLPIGQAGYFQVSPNGKLIAVQTADHIDIVDLQGNIKARNLVTYPQDYNHTWVPFSWTGDSTQLIVMLPLSSEENAFHQNGLLRSVWKYPINGNLSTEIRLDPAPMADAFAVSPDGKWIAYTSYYYAYVNNNTNENDKFGIYLANLNTGDLHRIADGQPENYDWAQDSIHFIAGGYQQEMYVGDIHGNIAASYGIGYDGWLDNSHYLYRNGTMREVGKDTIVSVLQPPDSFSSRDLQILAFVLLKP